MREGVLFSETQRFRTWWVLILLIGCNTFFLIEIVENFATKKESKEEIVYLCVEILSVVVFNFLFFIVRLETQITKEGIYVRFFPFHLKFKFYDWKNISKFYIRQYQPIIEYGGWGIRIGLFGKGRAFNVRGNKGLQLEFKDNNKLLIGSNNSEELERVLITLEKK